MSKPPGSLSGLQVAILFNMDHESAPPEGDDEPPSLAANAEVVDSAEAVAEALGRLGAAVHRVPVRTSLAEVQGALLGLDVDLVFNLVESLGGDATREAEVPSWLESLELPYTGSGGRALRSALNKDATRFLLSRAGVPVPAGVTIAEPARAAELVRERGLRYPLFVKPACADGSIGISQRSVVADEAALVARVAHLMKSLPGPCLVEEFLGGAEINVAVFPSASDGRIAASQIDFSRLPEGYLHLVSYDCKWTPGSPEYVVRSVPSRLEELPRGLEIAGHARRALLAIGAEGHGRVDFRLSVDGEPAVIDVNPNPDLHPEAGMALAAAAIGTSYEELVYEIVAFGLERGGYAHLVGRARAS